MYEICLEIVFFNEVLALGMQSSFAKAGAFLSPVWITSPRKMGCLLQFWQNSSQWIFLSSWDVFCLALGGTGEGQSLVVFWRMEVVMSRNKYHFCLVYLNTWKSSWKTVSHFFLSLLSPFLIWKCCCILLKSIVQFCWYLSIFTPSVCCYLYFTNKNKGYDYTGNFFVQTTCITHKKKLHV